MISFSFSLRVKSHLRFTQLLRLREVIVLVFRHEPNSVRSGNIVCRVHDEKVCTKLMHSHLCETIHAIIHVIAIVQFMAGVTRP